jgi:serralysin
MAASLAVIAWPAAASAATVEVGGTSLLYEGARGEINDLTISKARKGTLTVSDRGAPITPGAGCWHRSRRSVSCDAKGITQIVAKGNDLDDTLVNDTRIRSRLDGGDGKDRVVGGSKGDVLYGGDDQDRMSGRGGKDIIQARGVWADASRCGGGRDTVLADWSDSVRPSCESVDRPAAP